MKNPSDPQDTEDTKDTLEALQRKLAGLGESSVRKTYYPELQERLEELERFKALLDQSNDAIFLAEVSTGHIVDVNDSASRQMGWSRDELLERSLFDISDLQQTPPAASLISPPEDEGNLRALTVTSLRRKDGSRFWAEVTLNRMRFREHAYVLAVARDITQRRAMEEALRESEEFLKNVVDHIPAVVFAKEVDDLRFVTISKACQEVFGYSREEILGRNDYDLFPKDQADFFTQVDRQTLEKGELVEVPEEVITTVSGDRILRVKKIPLYDNQGKARFLLGIAEDITERKQLEEKLLQSQKMEAIGQLAGGVAHDFNNILMVILGYGSMLLNDGALQSRQNELVEQIMKAADKAAKLTSDLLAFSRKQVIKTRAVNLNDIILHVEKFLSRIIGEDVQLKAALSARDLMVDVDSGQIEQVLINLATNARDAMPRGGLLTVETALQQIDELFVQANGIGEPGPYAVISMSDTGLGMAEEVRRRIFEPFFTTKEVGKGTGLGMSIVYGIIKQHNGFINVYSEPGLGTTFRIYLPMSAGSTLTAEETQAVHVPPGGTETILVVEDAPDLRELLEKILSNAGYKVLLAENGEVACEMFAAGKGEIGLVLMDMVMPGMSGKEACSAIRDIDPAAKVLYTSGYTMDIIKNRDLLEEGTELLMKPVRPLEVLRKVREMLDR